MPREKCQLLRLFLATSIRQIGVLYIRVRFRRKPRPIALFSEGFSGAVQAAPRSQKKVPPSVAHDVWRKVGRSSPFTVSRRLPTHPIIRGEAAQSRRQAEEQLLNTFGAMECVYPEPKGKTVIGANASVGLQL